METKEAIALTRDCEIIQIPYGNKMMLPKGTRVMITQSLGGVYTLMTEDGQLVRLDGKDADAIGEAVAISKPSPPEGKEALETLVWNQLRTVYDPEIPVSVVELGLVYKCQITPLPEGGNNVDVQMSLTAPGCGMGGVLKADAESKIRALPGVKEVQVDIVFDPPWNPGMMTEAAKLQLGLV